MVSQEGGDHVVEVVAGDEDDRVSRLWPLALTLS